MLESGIAVTNIENDAGIKAGLRRAKQESKDDVEPRTWHEGGCDGDNAPRDHQRHDPTARPHAEQHQVAGNLKEKVAEEEHARRQTEETLVDVQVSIHGQRGETDIDAIEKRDEIKQDQERNQA